MKIFVQPPDYEVRELDLDPSTTVQQLLESLDMPQCTVELFGNALDPELPVFAQDVAQDDLLVIRKVVRTACRCSHNGIFAEIVYCDFDAFKTLVGQEFNIQQCEVVLANQNRRIIDSLPSLQEAQTVLVYRKPCAMVEYTLAGHSRQIRVSRGATVRQLINAANITQDCMLAYEGCILQEEAPIDRQAPPGSELEVIYL